MQCWDRDKPSFSLPFTATPPTSGRLGAEWNAWRMNHECSFVSMLTWPKGTNLHSLTWVPYSTGLHLNGLKSPDGTKSSFLICSSGEVSIFVFETDGQG